ncbi:hypothetical protein GUA46_01015 [Muricauda sp. HICW]|uniref:Uncharacterized protein n=1 Tax=Flagellimonas chongwuensis TaxID=2697365 RepID=A0A850NAL7_9FLAO|nr:MULTISPECIES: hypothetical protein [Allomuricauda]NVN16904.1 hypothetical protein [Allomuricauda chongwuensis]
MAKQKLIVQAVYTIKRLVAVAVQLFGNTKILRANVLQNHFFATTLFQSPPNWALFFSDNAAKNNATIKIKNNIAHFFIFWLFQNCPLIFDMPNIDN